MFKFIRNRGTHLNAERLKLQKELFEFNRTLNHGFPHRPSALATSANGDFIAIGTREGSLRIYGCAGVEFYAQIEQERKIDSIVFIGAGLQVIVKCEDNSIFLFEIPNEISADENSFELILIKSFDHFVIDLENDEKTTSNRITTLTVLSSLKRILIATEDGSIHFLKANNFELEENTISLEKVQSQLLADQPRLLGAAEQILEHPLNSNWILIGYNRGQIVLWNLETEKIEKFYSSGQQLESLCWSSETGDEFISSHNDGSYIVWGHSNNVQPSQQAKITYGPFPCKPITKIYGKSSENLIIFNGGMPRQLHGDRHTISIIQGSNDSAKHQVLDLTSKVVDFVLLEKMRALVILAEEELVAIDLNDSEWSQFRQPYLASVHSSPITFSQIYSDVSDELIEKLKSIGQRQNTEKHSVRDWPIRGGILKEKVYSSNNVLIITGHENGSVRLWDSSSCAMSPLCTINTAKYFGTDDDLVPIDSDEQEDGDEWPPFKKVGVFDPYSDDPRLGVRQVVLCTKTYNLLVAGTAGQLIVFELSDESAQLQLNRETIDLVAGLDFIWKSHECLPLETGLVKVESGYHPKSIVQLNPPASITALVLHTDWSLFAAGTTHGFAVFNYELNKAIAYKCTLNPTEISNISGSGNLITRKKSFRKSLRESFRKLRAGRSMRLTKKGGDKTSAGISPSKGSKPDGLDIRPIERQVEAKTTEDGIGSVVRCLYFANAPIMNQGQFHCTLWAGTNAGNVFIYLISDAVKEEEKNKSSTANESSSQAVQNISASSESQQGEQAAAESTISDSNLPADHNDGEIESTKNNETEEIKNKKANTNLTCILTKEIQLKHHAPVIFVQIIDSHGRPVEKKPAEDQSDQNYRVLICSNEQFKLFNLPNLKPYCKFKLTAHEGVKSRRIHIARFISRQDNNYNEHCIVNVNNSGDLSVFSILDLKKQLTSKCIKKEDLSGISSLTFANNGEGIFLNSPSEFSRFSLSANRIVKPNCLVSEINLDQKIVIDQPVPTANEEQANQSSSSLDAPNNDSEPADPSNASDATPSTIGHLENESTSQMNSKQEENKNDQSRNIDSKVAETTQAKNESFQNQSNHTQVELMEDDSKIISHFETCENIEKNEDCPISLVNGAEHAKETIPETVEYSTTQLSSATNSQTPISNGDSIVKPQNLVDVEVHQNGTVSNGKSESDIVSTDITQSNDEDEGEGKSLEDDFSSDKNDETKDKSNGDSVTPTSGIVDDDDDLLSETTIDYSPSKNHARENKKANNEPVKTFLHQYSEVVKNKREWKDSHHELESKISTTSANNSFIDNSMNMTSDITADSIKEHFNNFSLISDGGILEKNQDSSFD